MSWATAVVIIIAIICVTEVMKAKHRARHGVTLDEKGQEKLAQHVDAGLKREVEELRERIKVLERIATEDTDLKRLSSEIESLREK